MRVVFQIIVWIEFLIEFRRVNNDEFMSLPKIMLHWWVQNGKRETSATVAIRIKAVFIQWFELFDDIFSNDSEWIVSI